MFLLLLALALSLFSSVHADATNKLFQWQFANSFLSTSLPSCQPFPITVKNYNASNDTSSLYGPPFYMIAFEINGTPRTTLLGENETDLVWVVDHPVGTKLLLSVVDVNGSAGGVPPQLYTVVTGQSTTCIQPSPAPDFTITANVTDTLTTCQPWGIRIKGGIPPYNLTLAALNSPIITNLTLQGTDDAFTYIDRADPNTQLIAGISDLTGRWASGTPIVQTQGSSNVDCVGLVSSSGNSTQLAQAAADAAAAAEAARKHKTSVIAGVCVTFGILLLLAGGVFTWWYMRRRKARLESMSPEQQLDMSIKPFEEMAPSSSSGAEGQVLSINSWINPSTPASPKSAGFPGGSTLQHSSSTSSLGPNRDSTADSSSTRRPGFSSFPVRKVRNEKSGDAPSMSTAGLNTGSGEEGVREYVIQHRDGGGAVVRELPPPYADRALAGA